MVEREQEAESSNGKTSSIRITKGCVIVGYGLGDEGERLKYI